MMQKIYTMFLTSQITLGLKPPFSLMPVQSVQQVHSISVGTAGTAVQQVHSLQQVHSISVGTAGTVGTLGTTCTAGTPGTLGTLPVQPVQPTTRTWFSQYLLHTSAHNTCSDDIEKTHKASKYPWLYKTMK